MAACLLMQGAMGAGAFAEAPASETVPQPAVELLTPEPAPVQEPTQAPTQEPTQEPTQAPTQEPTQAPTQEPTQAPTQAPTQEPTQTPTQAPTQAPDAGVLRRSHELAYVCTLRARRTCRPSVFAGSEVAGSSRPFVHASKVQT